MGLISAHANHFDRITIRLDNHNLATCLQSKVNIALIDFKSEVCTKACLIHYNNCNLVWEKFKNVVKLHKYNQDFQGTCMN